jgi:ERCC4-type nuclease
MAASVPTRRCAVLLLDDRAGSKDLVPHFDKLGLPYRLDRLPFGDVAFLGRGPADRWLHIGVEYKTLDDVLSCLTTGRLAGHQVPGMRATYDLSFLLIEGMWQANPETGAIEVPRRGGWETLTVNRRPYMCRDLDKYLLTLALQGGLTIHRVGRERDSARWLGSLYHWWTACRWEDHSSLHTFDWSGPLLGLLEDQKADGPRVTRAIAAQLPGIGWVKSQRVVDHFGSVLAMVLAEEREWREIAGVGTVLAKRIVAALRSVEADGVVGGGGDGR